MAKTSKKLPEAPAEPKPAPKYLVSKDITEAEVIAYEKEGATLEFAGGARFKVLPESIVADLSHDNAKRYWVAFGEHKAEARRTAPKPMLEKIVDPLVGHEEARLAFTPRGREGVEFLKRNWLSWQFCTNASGFKQLGYKEVSEEDPVDVGISSNASGHYLTKDLQGRDELLLMKVDMNIHLQHEKAVAALSRQKVRGAREQFEESIDRVGRGKVPVMPESEEDQTVEKVRVSASDVDRAFLKK